MSLIRSFSLVLLIGIAAVGLTVSSARAALVHHIISFTETSPGTGGPFSGSFSVDASLLLPNTTIRISQLQGIEFSLYGITYDFSNFSDPENRGFRTDSSGVLKPVVTTLDGVEDKIFAQFLTGPQGFGRGLKAGVRLSNVYFKNQVWEFGHRAIAPCSGGGTLCSGTYAFTVVPAIPLAPIPLSAVFLLFGTGLGILGFLGWRRRRRQEAV